MKKTSFILAIILLSLSLTSLVSAEVGNFNSCPMGAMMYGSYGGGIMLLSWVFSLLVVIVLVLLTIWLIKQIQKK